MIAEHNTWLDRVCAVSRRQRTVTATGTIWTSTEKGQMGEAEEPFDHPVLRRGVGRDELLSQSIVPTRLTQSPGPEDEPVVRAHHRGNARGPKRSELLDASLPNAVPPLPATIHLLSAHARVSKSWLGFRGGHDRGAVNVQFWGIRWVRTPRYCSGWAGRVSPSARFRERTARARQ